MKLTGPAATDVRKKKQRARRVRLSAGLCRATGRSMAADRARSQGLYRGCEDRGHRKFNCAAAVEILGRPRSPHYELPQVPRWTGREALL
jgi:hypothetical protein